MKDFIVTLNNHQINIRQSNAGNPKGTILAIHGLTGNKLQLDFYKEKFDADYNFISLDLYGRGNSKANDEVHTIFDHANDILTLIDELELEDVILFGYSMGGFISAIVASETPKVKAVVLLDGAANMTDHQRPIVEPSLGRISQQFESDEAYIEQVASGYESYGIQRNQSLENKIAYEIEAHDGYWENKGNEAVIRNDWESFWDFDSKAVGSQIKQPVLLIQASGDIGKNPPLFLPEHYEDTIASIAQIEVAVSDANHYTLVFNQRDDVNQYIQRFLKNIED